MDHRRTATTASSAKPDIVELEQYASSLIAAVTDDCSSARAAELEAEHTRVLEQIANIRAEQRRNFAAKNGLDWNIYKDMPDVEARAQMWDDSVVKSEREQPRTFPHLPMEATFDNPDFRGNAVAEALYSKMTGKPPEGASREFASRSLLEIGRHMLEAGGARTSLMSKTQIADAMLTRAWGTAPGMHSTSDFSALLQMSGQRVLLEAYEHAGTPLKQLARRRLAPDFRTLTAIRLSEAPQLLEVPEGGEVKYGSRAETKESYRVRSFARIFSLSRQSIVNDDLSAFSDMTRAWGRSVAELEASELASLITDNAVLDDGQPWFHVTHENIADSGAAPDVTTLSTARRALRDARGLDGVTPLGLTPRFILAGSALETDIEKLLVTISPAEVTEAKPFSGRLVLLIEPRLAGNGWYIFADPAQAAVIEFANLEGQPGPMLEQRDGWSTLGSEYRCVFDFGAGIIGHRGSYKNPGAGG